MIKNFYKTVWSLSGFSLFLAFYLGLFFIVILAFKHFSGHADCYFLLEMYGVYCILFFLVGMFFVFKMNVFLFVWWRFLAGLCFVFFKISVLVQVAYFSGWYALTGLMIFSLAFYTFLFLLRFVFWSDFYYKLRWYHKIEHRNGEDVFYLKRDGYMEVYELNDKLRFLKFTAFWEKDFFSKSVSLNPEALAPYYKITGVAIALGSVVAAYTGFNVVSAGIIIAFSLIIPEFLRYLVAGAFLDAVLASKYKVGDTIDFSSKRQSASD